MTRTTAIKISIHPSVGSVFCSRWYRPKHHPGRASEYADENNLYQWTFLRK
jgi:hypothetical protein